MEEIVYELLFIFNREKFRGADSVNSRGSRQSESINQEGGSVRFSGKSCGLVKIFRMLCLVQEHELIQPLSF